MLTHLGVGRKQIEIVSWLIFCEVSSKYYDYFVISI